MCVNFVPKRTPKKYFNSYRDFRVFEFLGVLDLIGTLMAYIRYSHGKMNATRNDPKWKPLLRRSDMESAATLITIITL